MLFLNTSFHQDIKQENILTMKMSGSFNMLQELFHTVSAGLLMFICRRGGYCAVYQRHTELCFDILICCSHRTDGVKYLICAGVTRLTTKLIFLLGKNKFVAKDLFIVP